MLGGLHPYFVMQHSTSEIYQEECHSWSMMFFLFWRIGFQQTIDIPIDTTCAPLLTGLFLYLHEADFILEILKREKKDLARSSSFTF